MDEVVNSNKIGGTIVVVWYLNLQLHVQSVHITTKVVSSNSLV
jgi:hypothetical protein